MATWKFGSKPIKFCIEQYTYGGGNAVKALHRNGLCFTISVNMPDAPALPDGQFYLKDWSENYDIARAMIEEGIIEAVVPPISANSGFVTAQAYQFTALGAQYCKKPQEVSEQ